MKMNSLYTYKLLCGKYIATVASQSSSWNQSASVGNYYFDIADLNS